MFKCCFCNIVTFIFVTRLQGEVTPDFFMGDLEILLYSAAGALFICLLPLCGLVYRFVSAESLRIVLPVAVGLATGLMLGNAFIHLIPEAFHRLRSIYDVSIATMAGILFFFFLEKALRSANHSSPLEDEPGKYGAKKMGRMSLAGDLIHNFTDGTLIAGSFAISPEIGVATTIAIASHEVPQEISEAGLLMYSGYSIRRTLQLNLVTSLSCLLGAVVVIFFKNSFSLQISYLMPFTAGGFIYISTSNMMPVLQKDRSLTDSLFQGLAIVGGIVTVVLFSHHHIH